jgi:hydroxypyruvate isomerase
MKRRTALRNLALTAVGTASLSAACVSNAAENKMEKKTFTKLKSNIKQSVCRWCYGDMPLEELADFCKDLGMFSIELLKEGEWKIVQDRGLTCAVATGDISLTEGFNDVKNHAKLQGFYPNLIRKAAAAGLPNVICFSGNRNGISDTKGMENCAIGLDPLVKLAEKEGITLIMEVFNSKVDHPDYMADSTKWTVDLCKKMGSDRMKILYDIYHMQIMEGDIIRTIQNNHEYFAHYHTAGVPGRNEIDETQELYYPPIVKAILETGYTGYLGQEFIPKKTDKLGSLRDSVLLCDV